MIGISLYQDELKNLLHWSMKISTPRANGVSPVAARERRKTARPKNSRMRDMNPQWWHGILSFTYKPKVTYKSRSTRSKLGFEILSEKVATHCSHHVMAKSIYIAFFFMLKHGSWALGVTQPNIIIYMWDLQWALKV